MADENLAALVNASNTPMAKTLGIVVTLATKAKVEAEMLVTPQLCTIPETAHGGALMAFADNLGALGAFLNLPDGAATTTVESKTNFLRPIPAGQRALGVATPVNIGRTLQVWETRISREDGKLAAIVTQTQIVVTPR